MNEDHIIAAILTAGLVAKNSDEDLQTKDVITMYEIMLTQLFSSTRPQKQTD